MYKISANTRLIGKIYTYLPTCHSTNDIAAELVLQKKASDGQVIFTSHQTAGRGQRGNTWQTDPDQNLTFSCILKPHFLLASEQFLLNMAISLAIKTFVQSFCTQQTCIKWPNDIYIGSAKTGGILIENYLKATQIDHAIVGIGLNINQTAFQIPQATSIALATQKYYEMATMLEGLLEQLESYYFSLQTPERYSLKATYLNALYWYQERHTFEDLQGPAPTLIEGEILGVDNFGKLALHTQGKIRYFDFKEIRFIS